MQTYKSPEHYFQEANALNQRGQLIDAVSAYRAAADGGHPEACLAMAAILALGQGVSPDRSAAKAYLKAGYQAGHAGCGMTLAAFMAQEDAWDDATNLMSQLAGQGVAIAWRELGLLAVLKGHVRLGMEALHQAVAKDGLASLLMAPLLKEHMRDPAPLALRSTLVPYEGGELSISSEQGAPELERLAELVKAPLPNISMQALHHDPHIAVSETAVSPLICNAAALAALPGLQPARIIDPATGQERYDPYRTGATMTHSPMTLTPSLVALRNMMAQLAGVPQTHCESLAVIAYRPGEEYKPHYDALDEDAEPQRTRTVLLNLNDQFSGGGTDFPILEMRVEPKAGQFILFDNADETGKRHPASLHAGLPVNDGMKLIASLWVRGAPYTDPALQGAAE